ncbi:MAG: TlpA family protein disulfide reductase [Phycisphaerales bacterium]|nr:TlpA family protein disulfide reductase [Phycisphaerales bacterium]
MLARFRSTVRRRTLAPTLVLATLACPALAQDAVLEAARDGGTGLAPPPPPAVEIVPNTPPPKEHDQDALAVLDEAEKAIDELESFRATLALSATQWSRDFADQGEVSVVARRSPEDREQWQIRLTGELMPERSRDRISIDAFFDGQRMRWVDPGEERIGARILPVRMRTTYFDTPIRLRDRLFTSGKSIEEIRSSTRVYLDERQTIDGVECEVVVGEPGDGGFRFELFVGVEDHLPRRYVHRIDMTQMGVRGTSVADYKELEPGVRVSDAAFVIPVPDGWFEEQFPRPVTPGVPVPGNTTEDGTPEGDGDGAMAAEADGTVSGGDDSDENQARINAGGANNQGADPNTSVLTATPGDGSTSPTVASTNRPTTQRPRTGPAPTGEIEIAPDFALRDKDAQIVRLSELAGQRVVIVFWGSWNPWARSLLGELRPALEDAENTRLLVLGVRERSEAAAREQFDRQTGPGTLLLGAERVAADYKVDAVPTVVVLDENGRVLLRHVGFAASESPVERIRAVLGISGD